jgi:hypothetical protein
MTGNRLHVNFFNNEKKEYCYMMFCLKGNRAFGFGFDGLVK